jgi:hypothetical protein
VRARGSHFALFALVGACGASFGEELDPPGDAFVRFVLGDRPPDFADVPFPSELYRDAQGRIALGALPNPKGNEPKFAAIRELLSERDGFCATCNVTFAIEGGLSIDSLSTPDALEDAVFLVDVDPDSPEWGRRFPLRWQWDALHGWLSVRPVRGLALHGGRRYAAVVTSAARGGDGLPVGPAPQLVAVRDDRASDDPRLHALLAAMDELETLGLAREHIAGLAAFTTEDPTADLRAIRSIVRNNSITSVEIDATWTGEALDELLGTPAESRPGLDVPPAAGTEGTSTIVHETTAIVVAGRFTAPRFVSGNGTDVGLPTRQAGSPMAEHSDEVPFVLIVPRDADLTRLPVVVSHHGFNASRTTGFVLADTVGRAGFAVLAIDAYQHGARAASARDEWFAMRGMVPGADGFAEASTLDVSMRVFGLLGVDPDLTLHPGYPLGAFEQFVADTIATIGWVLDGDVSKLREADPMLAGLAFDPGRIAFVGNSMGAVVGAAVVAVEPDLRAAVLDVMPGSIVETLVESPEFRPLTEQVLLAQIGVTDDFDEMGRAMIFDPTVDLIRWVLEPVDPLALAPYILRGRTAESMPNLLVQLAGHDEVAAPPASESVVAAAGIPGHGDFAFATVEPFSGGSVGAVRMTTAMHGMLEVATQVSSWQAPLEPPLVRRESGVRIDNPIVEVHGQIETFLRSFAEEGHGEIIP